MQEILARHLDLSPAEVEQLLSKQLDDLLSSPAIEERLAKVDASLLKQSLPTVSASLSEKFPSFYNWLKNEFEVARDPESPEGVTPWLINCFSSKENLARLIESHSLQAQSRVDMEQMVPELIGMFDKVEDAHLRQEWQKAIALVCVVLLVGDREHALSRGALV